MKQPFLIIVAAILLGLSGCTVGPRYSRPAAPAPAPDAWKTQPPWEQAAPKDAIPKGAWWSVFHDAQLETYEQQLLKANQSLEAARGRLNQARSLARVATADFFPQVAVDPSAYRERGSANRPLNGAAPTVVNGVVQPVRPYTQSVYSIPFSLNYEADLFGRVRRNVEAANANLQSTAADLGNVQLVLTAELAADYFTLRELDAEYKVVEESVDSQRRALQLVQARHDGGIASGLEVAQQQTVLESTVSQASLVQQSRAQYEHAIAVLVGQPASTFSVPLEPLNATPPPVPLGVPSDILERRPDIATEERLMAYENAQVGIARTAFYPHITIGGSGGWQSTSLSSLLNAPSLVWSIGADALEPVIEGGRNRANLAAARAAYDQSVANYRQSVLTAFQQVEDELAALRARTGAASAAKPPQPKPETIGALRSLGYLSGPSHTGAESRVDPKDRIADLERYFNALNLASSGRLTESNTLMRSLREKLPDVVDIRIGLGLNLQRQGDFAQAAREFQAAIELAPSDTQAHFELGFCDFRLGKLDEAIPPLKAALALEPWYTRAEEALAEISLQRKDFAQALTYLNHLLTIDPGSYTAHYNLGILAAMQGNWDEAQQRMLAALRSDPGSAEAHDTLGKIHFQRGELEPARRQFEEAIRLQPKLASAHYDLAMVLQKQGKAEESARELRAAREADASGGPIRKP